MPTGLFSFRPCSRDMLTHATSHMQLASLATVAMWLCDWMRRGFVVAARSRRCLLVLKQNGVKSESVSIKTITIALMYIVGFRGECAAYRCS